MDILNPPPSILAFAPDNFPLRVERPLLPTPLRQDCFDRLERGGAGIFGCGRGLGEDESRSKA